MRLFITFITFITIITIIPIQSRVYAAGLGCAGDSFGPMAKFLCALNPDPSSKTGNAAEVGKKLNAVISTIIGFLTVIAGIWFLFQFIVAGYQWINSQGDKNNTQAAQDKITNSLIGLIIIVIAWVIVGTLGKLLGIELLDPGATINSLMKNI